MNLALLVVLVAAAASKLVRPAAAADHMADLGLRRPRLLARAVPVAELAVGLVLVAAPGPGAAAALGLLAAFTVVLVRTVRSGRQVSCGCLGAFDRGRPVSWRTVARNLVLMAMAAAAVVVPGLRWAVIDPDAVAVATLVAGPAAVVALVGAQLVTLHHRLGRLWSVRLAGDAAAPSARLPRRSGHPAASLANPLPSGGSTGRNLP
ncbi:MAG: MauE/DoxX family redox-associated membrane protein [Acidimicrobiales bacterium]